MRLLENAIPALLIGSTAAKYWWPHLRDPADCDVYCSNTELRERLGAEGMQVQIATARNGILGFVERARTCPTTTISGIELPVASPQMLLTIKAVHINYPNKFKKNIRDYLVLRRLVLEEPIESLVVGRMRYLDAITGINRKLDTPAGFWDREMPDRIHLLRVRRAHHWCIYARDEGLRRFAQDHYCELLYEKDRNCS